MAGVDRRFYHLRGRRVDCGSSEPGGGAETATEMERKVGGGQGVDEHRSEAERRESHRVTASLRGACRAWTLHSKGWSQ